MTEHVIRLPSYLNATFVGYFFFVLDNEQRSRRELALYVVATPVTLPLFQQPTSTASRRTPTTSSSGWPAATRHDGFFCFFFLISSSLCPFPTLTTYMLNRDHCSNSVIKNLLKYSFLCSIWEKGHLHSSSAFFFFAIVQKKIRYAWNLGIKYRCYYSLL